MYFFNGYAKTVNFVIKFSFYCVLDSGVYIIEFVYGNIDICCTHVTYYQYYIYVSMMVPNLEFLQNVHNYCMFEVCINVVFIYLLIVYLTMLSVTQTK
jgi:hypothetical protein